MKNEQKLKPHKIKKVVNGSIAEELELEPGDTLLAINGKRIQDVFDYRYLLLDEEIEITIQKHNHERWDIEIEKDYHEDLGLVFETELMDELLRCRNKCKFCFIDQLPPNMRETVYIKDDDWRMSFLNGNYITLTNMSEYDMERLIKYKLSPINISIHATNADVRKELLTNPHAGRIVEQIRRLVDAGIQVNGQIVLCKGINDGKILDQTIQDLSEFIPDILSLTVVPVGISKYRHNLPTLEPFDEASSKEVIHIINKWQQYYLEKMGTRFVFVSDEFYVVAKESLPTYSSYEDFKVLDNGVGMLTKFKYELINALDKIEVTREDVCVDATIITGKITEHYMKGIAKRLREKLPHVALDVVGVKNEFFGENVTVTGLLTGEDIVTTLKKLEKHPKILLLAENMLKCGEELLLDDYTICQLEEQLQTKVVVVPNEGTEWLSTIIQLKENENE